MSDEEQNEVLLSCRYGDLDDVKEFVEKHGADLLNAVRDESGNTPLHMAAANGHIDVLDYLLTLATSTLIGTQNDSGSTALHWASLNSQLDAAKHLVNHPNGLGIDLIDIKNKAGRSPLGEAELIGWEEGAQWFVEVMRLDDDAQGVESTGDGDAVLDNPDGSTPDIEVEIQDADGGIARMTISGKPASSSQKADATT